MHMIIAGRKPVLEALKAGTQIERIVVLENVHGAIIEEIHNRARGNNIEISETDQQGFRRIAGDAAAQGVVAVMAGKRFAELTHVLNIPVKHKEMGFILILDGIEDPHNLGALVRTAECAGVHGVVLPKHHAAAVTSSVVKASAGATEHIAIVQVTNIVRTLEKLKEEGYWIIGLDASGTKEYTAVEYSTAGAIVVGNEGKGIRRLVKEHCDHLVRIPLQGRIASLNASVAGALVMYEVVRQRHPQ